MHHLVEGLTEGQANGPKGVLLALMGGLGASILFGYLLTLNSASGSLLAYPNQSTIQFLLAILMFCYYLGKGYEGGEWWYVFMIGFLSGALVVGGYLWATTAYYPSALWGILGCVMFGLFLGLAEEVTDNDTFHSAVKYLLNIFGWLIQGASVAFSVGFFSVSVSPAVPTGVITFLHFFL